ncbi:hypothetical protein N7449_005090 [Penicillium cf. viridicatum]|uniref:Uncharacterized protein n=1 Tax=Penicillium cf. viridicatum TaxID=2972119 RepID=A0A9W9MKF8_9EURO|nr:hypothetical protein N7449_005090 [Penicillium cf. viridicatum]
MDYPTSPCLCDRPAKRQCRVSYDLEDENELQSHPHAHTRFPYGRVYETSTLQRRPSYTSPQTARPVLLPVGMLRRQICREDTTRARAAIASRLCNEQALILWDRKQVVRALCNGVVSALQASDPKAFHNGLYPLFQCCFVLILADRDLDLDLPAIWQESSDIPTPPPCLATDSDNPRRILSDGGEPVGCGTLGSSLIECLFHPTYDKLSAFKWTGLDPLSMFTQASDMFLYMSAFAFPKEVQWIEFRLIRFDRKFGEITGEHLFFLPRVETVTWNLRRVRGQLLDTISWHEFGATGTSFRLSLWPRMEPLPHSSHLTIPPLAALPTTVSLDPRFFVHNILGNYK